MIPGLNTDEKEAREQERKNRVQCRQLYELSQHEHFDVLLEYLKAEEDIIVAHPTGGVNGMLDYLAAKVWQDAVKTVVATLQEKIKAGELISGKDTDDLAPGEYAHGEERHSRSEPQRRRA